LVLINPSAKDAPFELPFERQQAHRLWLAEVRSFLQQIRVPDNLEAVVSELSRGRAYRRLFEDWEALSARHRRRRWEELARATEKAAYATRPHCLRCGECCTRHTPALHLPDLPLIREGVLARALLVTLRKGERAYSPRQEAAVLLKEEMIKIRQPASGGPGPCYDPATRSCTIYERRPLQCRALKCWEPEGFLRATAAPHLRRRDVIAADDPINSLILRHEREVDCGLALRLLGGGKEKDGSGLRAVREIVEREARLRQEALSVGAEAAELDFLFGRPLGESLADLLPLGFAEIFGAPRQTTGE
jgi:Fe-S-cluster containining protein